MRSVTVEGRTVLIKKSFGGPRISNDGVTVAKSIVPADPIEQTGAQLPSDSLAEPPRDTPARVSTPRPFRLHRVRKPRG